MFWIVARVPFDIIRKSRRPLPMITFLVRSMTEGRGPSAEGTDWSPLGKRVGSPQMA